MALSAVDYALWDLAARLADQPRHRLLGGVSVDCIQVNVTRCGGITELLQIPALVSQYQLGLRPLRSLRARRGAISGT
ncbi:MAG: hypothetical protein WAN44_13970 [Propionibacteriaceae bacterium]